MDLGAVSSEQCGRSRRRSAPPGTREDPTALFPFSLLQRKGVGVERDSHRAEAELQIWAEH